MNFKQLTDIAIKAAKEAGKIIQDSLGKNVVVENKEGGNTYASQVVTAVDIACEKVILKHLLPTCNNYDIAILSEETKDDKSRFEKDFFWCVDPMDGTLAFINKQPGFSVSIALVTKDGVPVVGVVYDPSTNNLYYAIKGYGAFKNGNPWVVKSRNDYLTYVTDKKLLKNPNLSKIETILNEIVKEFDLKEVREVSGSGAVLNAIKVVENAPAIMLKLPKKENGGGSLWDYAATVCIFNELGLQASNFERGKLELNKKETTFMNHQGILYENLSIHNN